MTKQAILICCQLCKTKNAVAALFLSKKLLPVWLGTTAQPCHLSAQRTVILMGNVREIYQGQTNTTRGNCIL